MFELRTNGLVHDYLSAWSRHSADYLAALYAGDALYEDLRLSATLRGRTAIRTHLCQVLAASRSSPPVLMLRSLWRQSPWPPGARPTSNG